MSSSMAASPSPAPRNSPWNWRRRATIGSSTAARPRLNIGLKTLMATIERTLETKPDVKPQPSRVASDIYREKFGRLKASGPAWVLAARQAALARFSEVGFPTLRDEDWRFTNIAPIARLPFKPV